MNALAEKVQGLRKPSPKLLWYYLIVSFAGLVFQPLVFLPLFFKYHTLEYHFDDKGVRCAWGILFRREVFLTYGRIQDIHLTRGLLERWLGLGTVDVQTASGSEGAVLSIVGLEQYLEVRDFLYARMRGFKDEGHAPAKSEVLEVLTGIRDELRAANTALKERA